MENKIYTKDGVTIAANTGRILSSEKVLVTPEVPEQIIPAWTEEVQDGFEIIYHPEEIIPAWTEDIESMNPETGEIVTETIEHPEEIIPAWDEITDIPKITIIEHSEEIIPAIPAVYDYSWIINPTEQDLIDNGWVEYEDTIEEIISKKLEEITEYDTSDNVNTFSISGEPVEWVNLTNRMGIKHRYSSEADDHICSVSFGVYNFAIPKLYLDSLLKQLEDYAGTCWDVTNAHKTAVSKLNSKDEIEMYDFKIGYPEPLNFEI